MLSFHEIVTGNLSLLEKKGEIFISSIKERMRQSISYIENEYENNEKFNSSLFFISHFLIDTIKSNELAGNYPIVEARKELDNSIKHALIGSYKCAFFDLRKALELALVIPYFNSETSNVMEVKNWINSKSNTPGFSKIMSKLLKNQYFKEFNNEHQWKSNIQKLYRKLSDIVHNKGIENSYEKLNNQRSYLGTTTIPKINFTTLKTFCDLYIQTVEEIIIIMILYNPIILVGLPLEEKYGFFEPLTGFFQQGQADILHRLIPNNYKDYFKDLAENDPQIEAIANHINSLPNLTKEELKKQEIEFRKVFKSINIEDVNKII